MTSLLVYPLPSIADESFLQLIFQGKVTRSLFAGFGKRRFALAEIANDNDFATKISEAIKSHNSELLQHEQQQQQQQQQSNNNAQKHELCQEENGLAKEMCTNTVGGKEALLHTWLSELNGEENVTLAELYNEPTLADILYEEENAPQTRKNGRKGKRMNINDNDACKGDNMDLAKFVNEHNLEYLNHLFWREQPVHVNLSPVELDEFYQCGGIVPQHHFRQNKKGIINGNNDKINSEKEKGKETYSNKKTKHEVDTDCNKAIGSKQSKKMQERLEHSDKLLSSENQASTINHSSDDNYKNNNKISHIAGSKRPRAVQENNNAAMSVTNNKMKSIKKFPKDCCQKCGSADHFTRYCTTDSNITNKESYTNSNSNDANNNKKVKHDKQAKDEKAKEQKEINVNKKEDVSVQNTAITTMNTITKANNVDQRKHGNSNVANINASSTQANDNKKNVKVQSAVFVRTSKDQCKYCGSEDHLSRHCPQKGQ